MIVQRPPGLRGAFRSVAFLTGFIGLILFFCYYLQIDTPLPGTYQSLREAQNTLIGSLTASKTSKAEQFDYDSVTSIQSFWSDFRKILEVTKPPTKALEPTSLSRLLPPSETSSGELPDLIPLTPTELRTIKHAHARFVTSITASSSPKLVFKPSTHGIVTTAGTSYLPVLLISLRMLRRTGCTLPVEVFVTDDRDRLSNICQQKLPALNAQCLDMSYLIGTDTEFIGENRYLYKILAMLFSSFEDMLFLDSDNLPIMDPTSMLSSEPYSSTGLIAWNDFWNSTTSPRFYDIAEIPLSEALRGSVESGQLLLSKSKHAETLLLSSYYNFHGASHYYPLLSQGGHGLGDKDTFLAAAMALEKPYYLVEEPAGMVGQWEKGDFHGVGMVQFDPIQDREHHAWRASHPRPTLLNGTEEFISQWVMEDDKRKPGIMFVHHHMPKLKPSAMFTQNAPTRDSEGRLRRMWGKLGEVTDRFGGVDVEAVMWKELCAVACDMEETGTLQEQQQQRVTEKRGERWYKNMKEEDPPGKDGGGKNGDVESGKVCWRCRNYMKVVFREESTRGEFFKGHRLRN
ncbi:MAG: hypothetical protein Q9227_008095 [Pyrenula ochraceoflavens]